jgi:hypothetical protein
VHRSQFEPRLLDLLADPLTQAVMDADRVDLRALIAMLSKVGQRLKSPRVVSEQEKNLPLTSVAQAVGDTKTE